MFHISQSIWWSVDRLALFIRWWISNHWKHWEHMKVLKPSAEEAFKHDQKIRHDDSWDGISDTNFEIWWILMHVTNLLQIVCILNRYSNQIAFDGDLLWKNPLKSINASMTRKLRKSIKWNCGIDIMRDNRPWWSPWFQKSRGNDRLIRQTLP